MSTDTVNRVDSRPPMPRDHGRWHGVSAPDGRGMPRPQPPRPPHRTPRFLVFVVILLALNWISLLVFQPTGQPRVRVPFSPEFLAQVQRGRVSYISSKGDTLRETLETKVRLPVGDRTAIAGPLFSTEVPRFWTNNRLAFLLQSKNVQINGQSPTHGTSLLGSLLLGFGPTLLIVGLFILLARRAAAGGGMGALGRFGRSKARRIDPATIRVMFSDVAGLEEAKAELSQIVDFLRTVAAYAGGGVPLSAHDVPAGLASQANGRATRAA